MRSRLCLLTSCCPHLSSQVTWSNSFCLLKWQLLSTRDTKPVTTPVAQLTNTSAASLAACPPPLGRAEPCIKCKGKGGRGWQGVLRHSQGTTATGLSSAAGARAKLQ